MSKQEKFEQVFIGMALMHAKECHISKRDAFNACACWAHRCCERMRTGRDLRTGKIIHRSNAALTGGEAVPSNGVVGGAR